MKKCTIIGGGVVGLCSAYYLAKEGHQVTIIDRSDLHDGCSYGNAGMIVPSHLIPLAQPGMITQGVKWMFNSSSPFYVKPRLSRELISWGLQFYKSANVKHVEKSMPALRDLSQFSMELYHDFIQNTNPFQFEEKGLLMLFKSDKVAEEETHVGNQVARLGLKVDFLSREGVSQLEKGINTDVIGGIHYVGDAHLSPNLFMEYLKEELRKMKVEFKLSTEIKQFNIQNTTIRSIVTSSEVLDTDEVILCAGTWSPSIAKMLGIKIAILPGKGYSFNIDNGSQKPTIPSILCEGKVAVTPMGNQVRFGGTLEITHTNDHAINEKRVTGIVNTVNDFYPSMLLQQPSIKDVWHGFRPCTPTGLPIISRSQKINNLIIASGHAMMGLSLAPATGRLVEELISEKKTSVDLTSFSI